MEIITRCQECNRTLDSDLGGDGICYVDLCPDCEKRIKKEAFDEGYEGALLDAGEE